MIATGGLLRISARKQDPLRTQSQAPKVKRKAKKKRKNDVVVVKGKLKLCSISGLIALCGILVLLVGVAMAVVGYWPKNNQVYQDSVGLIQAKQHSSEGNEVSLATRNQSLSHQVIHESGTVTPKSNISNVSGGTQKTASAGFFSKLFSGYLHSDKLKVFGPLIMGIGIFLFICANAVLHENRDKKTKIINLRDLYSTVIDVHSLRSKDSAPLNGFVNYVQSRGLDAKAGDCFGPSMLAKSSWHTAFSGTVNQSPLDLDEPRTSSPRSLRQLKEPPNQTDAVYSIYREPSASAVPGERIGSRDKNADLPSTQKELGKSSAGFIVSSSFSAFTLPVVKLDECLLESTKKCEPEEKGAKEIPRGEFELSLTDISRLNTRTQRHLLLRRQSTSCLPDTRRPISPEVHSQFRSSSLSSTDLDSSLLVKATTCTHSKTRDLGDAFTKASVIRRDSDSSQSDQSSNKGYTHLEEAGTSFESTDTPTNKTQDCENCDNPREKPSQESLIKEHILEKTQKLEKQYSNKEKLFMISRSHATLEEGELESAGI